MAHYKVILAYDGTHFLGFQRQGLVRTVQLEFENALKKLNWQERSILSSGRTDTGVHASGQVVAFALEWKHSPEQLLNALNATLPEDVAVKDVVEVRADFHPRFDAVERFYRYRIYTAAARDPLRERYAWRVRPTPAFDVLQSAARLLPGSHDFAAFGSPMKIGGSTIRTMVSANWEMSGDELFFEIRGNAFLYHMVRRMVYAQVQVGQNRLSLDDLDAAVRETRPMPSGLAPAQGLVLEEVRYGENRQEAVRYFGTLQ